MTGAFPNSIDRLSEGAKVWMQRKNFVGKQPDINDVRLALLLEMGFDTCTLAKTHNE